MLRESPERSNRRRRGVEVRRWIAGALLAALAWTAPPVAASEGEDAAENGVEDPVAALPERYRTWIEDVALLISEVEREVFLGLSESYQRDNFIRRFWKVRDPFTRTTRNELQESWQARAARARELFDNTTSARAEMLLYFGEPTRRNRYSCPEMIKPIEVWEYAEGSDRIVGYFTLVFIGLDVKGRGSLYQWEPRDGLSRLATTGQGFGATDRRLAQLIARECSRADEILSGLSQAIDLSQMRERDLLVPKPNDEWVRTFQARSTEIDEGAERLAGELSVSFPGRHQSRTVVQGLVAVPIAEVGLSEIGSYRSYNLLIDGEILRQGELFDQFRYRFDFPAGSVKDQIPLVVQRYLRPGPYKLIVKVEDLSSKRVFRKTQDLEVPAVSRKPVAAPGASGPPPGQTAAGPASTAGAASSAGTVSAVGVRLDEANASIATGDHTVRILSLPEHLAVGQLRVRAQAKGKGIDRVAFELNGQPVMRKSRPPYSVELNLGDRPRTHTLRALALDEDGKVLATDEVIVNAGPHSFNVRLIEPQSGKLYRSSVRAHAEVEVPEGERLDRVEVFLNEDRLATLYQPPFEQPILLDGTGDLTYVRAVAYLRDGTSAEDVRIINAPDYIDNLEVQFVELYTTVVDRKGNFVEDLSLEEVTVLEEGKPQRVRRFETMRDLPIRAGLVIDTSLSMMTSLSDVKKAAHRFFESVLTERDRAALITFNDEPQLVVRFTNNQEILAGGLAGLVTEGETALYDSVIFSLHYFSGLPGKRAVVILTDGEDSVSNYSYEDVIDFARRTGVAIYVVGLRLQTQSNEVRMRMRRLASETGGQVFFIDRASQLGDVYGQVQEELRSQYLIAYQSSLAEGDEFREVEVKIDRKGLEAKTIRGYYP